jgi:hypothetical protein
MTKAQQAEILLTKKKCVWFILNLMQDQPDWGFVFREDASEDYNVLFLAEKERVGDDFVFSFDDGSKFVVTRNGNYTEDLSS